MRLVWPASNGKGLFAEEVAARAIGSENAARSKVREVGCKIYWTSDGAADEDLESYVRDQMRDKPECVKTLQGVRP